MPDRTEQFPIPLGLPFRGDRDYLHGTPMHDAMAEATLAVFPDVADTAGSIACHRLQPTQPDLWLAGSRDDAAAFAAPTASSGFDGPGVRGWLLGPWRPVSRREAFPDAGIDALGTVERIAAHAAEHGPAT